VTSVLTSSKSHILRFMKVTGSSSLSAPANGGSWLTDAKDARQKERRPGVPLSDCLLEPIGCEVRSGRCVDDSASRCARLLVEPVGMLPGDAKRLRLKVVFRRPDSDSQILDSLGSQIHYSRKLPPHPFDFPADILDDVARLEVFGEHIPCVGFNLQLS
jgi:hypothetical protein